MELPWKQPEASSEVASTEMVTAFVEVPETSRGSCYYFRGSLHGSSFHGSSTQLPWKRWKLPWKWWKLPWKQWKLPSMEASTSFHLITKNAEDRVCQEYCTIDCLCISVLGYHPSAKPIRGHLLRYTLPECTYSYVHMRVRRMDALCTTAVSYNTMMLCIRYVLRSTILTTR